MNIISYNPVNKLAFGEFTDSAKKYYFEDHSEHITDTSCDDFIDIGLDKKYLLDYEKSIDGGDLFTISMQNDKYFEKNEYKKWGTTYATRPAIAIKTYTAILNSKSEEECRKKVDEAYGKVKV